MVFEVKGLDLSKAIEKQINLLEEKLSRMKSSDVPDDSPMAIVIMNREEHLSELERIYRYVDVTKIYELTEEELHKYQL